ncbi:hypothetical protein C475_12385 [Halosimplex carlsbadense 2-9-1]|uniref:Uncharacterized protein n=1 Tax=Halosimplex carlsbadense 2-9-1 TaxID=797114 RepID=M0CQ77_9EURY|nr:hypothetical protein [Halosimplex carlsbadense]ELZ24537.1 hypothetical protein C475_12385 [Halosimplex carlsbadense 2-9-1]
MYCTFRQLVLGADPFDVFLEGDFGSQPVEPRIAYDDSAAMWKTAAMKFTRFGPINPAPPAAGTRLPSMREDVSPSAKIGPLPSDRERIRCVRD